MHRSTDIQYFFRSWWSFFLRLWDKWIKSPYFWLSPITFTLYISLYCFVVLFNSIINRSPFFSLRPFHHSESTINPAISILKQIFHSFLHCSRYIFIALYFIKFLESLLGIIISRFSVQYDLIFIKLNFLQL
jgi:hypothetical protein